MSTLSMVTSSLERAWTAIRTVFPVVRPAAMVIYLHPQGDRKGHYAPNSWITHTNGRLDEVHISSHLLEGGGRAVFGTLLHEAVHSANRSMELQDCSRQGRYHNTHFKAMAEDMGLAVGLTPQYGWAYTELTDEIALIFAAAIAEIEESVQLWQELPQKVVKPPTTKKGSDKLTCPACKRIIRASAKTRSQGPIICAPCGVAFQGDEDVPF